MTKGSYHHSDVTRKKISESGKGRRTFLGKRHTQVSRKKMSDAKKGRKHHNYGKSLSETTKEKISKTNTGKHHTNTSREKMSRSRNGRIFTEKTIIKLCEAKYKGFWYGAVTYPVVYCELFTEEFKERVRAYFDYICVECGTPQNGKKLHIHHVHYDKKTCCKSGEKIGDRMFVALCKSCHPKTNTDRHYWEQYFTDIIKGYYQGKCFFTKEEFRAIKGVL